MILSGCQVGNFTPSLGGAATWVYVLPLTLEPTMYWLHMIEFSVKVLLKLLPAGLESSLQAQRPQDNSNTCEIYVDTKPKKDILPVTISAPDPGGITSGNQGSNQQLP